MPIIHESNWLKHIETIVEVNSEENANYKSNESNSKIQSVRNDSKINKLKTKQEIFAKRTRLQKYMQKSGKTWEEQQKQIDVHDRT